MKTLDRNTRPWMTLIAGLAMALGLLAALVTLLAPLGIWLGLWEFGTGFGILGAVVPWSGWVALVVAAIGVLLLVLARVWHTRNGLKLFNLTAIGALAAAIAWYIPNSFQAPDGEFYPPIHDISTDTVNPPSFVAVLPLRADAPNTTIYGGTPDLTPERLAQLQREAYPDIRPVVLNIPPEQAFERTLRAVDEMGWELVDADPMQGRIEATDTTFWFRFKDDVVIRITREGDGTRIDARSVSRVGRGDVGTNAKRLRRFFEVLQET